MTYDPMTNHICPQCGTEHSYYDDECPVKPDMIAIDKKELASLRSSLAAANEAKEKKEAALCRARDVRGITTVIIETYEQRKYEAERDAQFRDLFIRDAVAVVKWINSTAPCAHEARVKALEEEISNLRYERLDEKVKELSEILKLPEDKLAALGCQKRECKILQFEYLKLMEAELRRRAGRGE